MQRQAGEQRDIARRTGELSEEMRDGPSSDGESPLPGGPRDSLAPGLENLDESRRRMGDAAESLERDDPEQATQAQEQALEHLRQTLRELDESREMMLTLGRKTASEKVATFLHLLATHIDPEIEDHNGPIEFELALKRSDIADYLGLTIETVSRQMTKLRKAGIIDIHNNRHIRIPNLDRLIDATES